MGEPIVIYPPSPDCCPCHGGCSMLKKAGAHAIIVHPSDYKQNAQAETGMLLAMALVFGAMARKVF